MKQFYSYLLLFLLFVLQTNNTVAQNDALTARLETEMEHASLLMPWDDANKRIKENVFIKVITNKKACFIGEPLLVTYKVFTRLQSHSKVIDAPTFSGCSVIEMTTNNLTEEKELVNGKLYKTFIIRKVQVLPLQEGSLTLGEVSVDNKIIFYQTENGHLVTVAKQAQLKSTQQVITVKPLPTDSSNNPLSTTIGKFFMIATVAKTVDTANDNNSLSLTITGSGNFMNMHCPALDFPNGILAFEPKESELLDKLSFPVIGEKKFVIPFSCKHEGNYVIPPISFTYFDADSGKYVSTKTNSIQIKVMSAVPLIDPEKVTDSVSNFEYLWIVPAIGAIVGIVMMFYSYKKKKSILEVKMPTYKETVEKKVAFDKIKFDFQQRLEYLKLNIDEAIFYADTKKLSNELLEACTNEDYKHGLNEVISSCNEALYAFKEGDKVEMIAVLQRSIYYL